MDEYVLEKVNGLIRRDVGTGDRPAAANGNGNGNGAHPASPGFVRGALLDEIVYPLVRELDEWEQLEYDLGLREDEPTIKRESLTIANPHKVGSNGNY